MRHTLLGADIAEDVQLLLIFSAHAFFLPGRVVETRAFSGTGTIGLPELMYTAIIHRMDETGVQITLVLLGLVAIVVAVAIGWWWRQRKRVEETEGWFQTEATIESGGLEGTAQGRARLPTFAFSYQIAGKYYSGRFALLRHTADPDRSLIDRMIGRKLQVRYDPRRPEVWFIPDKVIEGCKVEQKVGPHFIALYPKN